MHLKRLEIAGFKSFRDRVVLDFFPGITAIVGPNGCGKSNVVDALRWVMGEQQVRYIRGKKIEDVIFHGSDEAQAVSLAEVTLLLARKENQPFPEPYENFQEISVTRKHFREGESEYFINKLPCRLMDIREFFMGTGVGSRSYSIVEQNSISQLIEAKPEDRRIYVEEAAGISKYKARKEAAAKKIESTKQNLARLNDIIKEVKGQLTTLSRQAKRAEEFRNLKGTLKKGEITLSVHAYRSLKAEEESKKAILEALRKEELEAASHLADFEARIASVKEKITEEEAAYLSLQELLYQQQNDIRLKEQKLEYLRDQIRELKERQSQQLNHIAEIDARRGEIEKRQLALTSELDGIVGGEEEQRHAVKELEEELKHLRSEESQLQEEMEKIRSQYVNLAAEKARLKNEANAIDRMLEAINKQKEKDEKEREHLQEWLSRLSRQMEETEAEILQQEKALNTCREELSAAKREDEDLQQKLKTLEERISSIKEALSSKTTRLASLKEFHEDYAWCNRTTQAIMTSAGKSLEGLISLVADCLSVQAGYERAVESVLGEKLQYVIVRSVEDGLEAIDYLKEAALGRGHFVPLELKTENAATTKRNLPAELDPLLKHVAARADFAPILNLLLGDTFVVSDLRQAVKFWSNNGFRGTLVTFEGDVLTPHGILSGGSNGEGERSVFRDKREINDLEEEIGQLNASLAENQHARENTSSLRQACLNKIKELTDNHHRLELQLNTKKKDREKLAGEWKRLDQSLKTLAYNLRAKATEEESLKGKRLLVNGEMASTIEKEEEISQHLAALQKKSATTRIYRERAEGEITRYRIALASLEEKRTHLQNEKKRLVEEVKSLTARREQLSEEIKKAEGTTEKLLRERKDLEENIASLYTQIKASEGKLSEQREKREELAQTLKQWEEKAQEGQRKLDELKHKFQSTQEEMREIQFQLTSLERNLREKFSLTMAEVMGEFPPCPLEEIRAWEEKLRSVRDALDNFGEVNLLAIDEYHALKERFDFLTAQAADLNQSIHSLQRTITKINRLSRERFAQTFTEVNSCFQRLFNRIFPGGRGELVLVDEDNLLETGIDVEIQLPGKKRQHISLLSGGEKAMVALTFILSFILYRPTPFLVLDEVDAALDDSNINLFTNLLKDIAHSSQVIVITHNKITMEAAQYLYGITMEKKGISKVISVSLD